MCGRTRGLPGQHVVPTCPISSRSHEHRLSDRHTSHPVYLTASRHNAHRAVQWLPPSRQEVHNLLAPVRRPIHRNRRTPMQLRSDFAANPPIRGRWHRWINLTTCPQPGISVSNAWRRVHPPRLRRVVAHPLVGERALTQPPTQPPTQPTHRAPLLAPASDGACGLMPGQRRAPVIKGRCATPGYHPPRCGRRAAARR